MRCVNYALQMARLKILKIKERTISAKTKEREIHIHTTYETEALLPQAGSKKPWTNRTVTKRTIPRCN